MKYQIGKPRKMRDGSRAKYPTVRIATESAYEDQAIGKLSPAQRSALMASKKAAG